MNSRYEPPLTFLCGPLRSGTTVLGLMFAHHPFIHAPGEYDFLFDYFDKPIDATDRNAFVDSLMKDRVFNASKLAIKKFATPVEIVHDFIEQLSVNNKHLLINVHRNFEKIPEIFPDSRYIHLRRDPRDVARSAIGMGWCGNVYYGVDYWLQSEKSWDRLISNIDKQSYTDVSFESLICNTETELTRLCNFLGVDYDDRMLSYPENTTYSLPDVSLTSQWKRKQTKREVQLVESKLGSYLEMKGYQKSGFGDHMPGILEKICLWLQNKSFQYQFGIKRYGIYLFLMEKISRNLRIQELHKRYIDRVNEIDMLYLK